MCIYCGSNKYRKIYENHFGKIPKDEQGRTYDIHHIDGNRHNNNHTNLKAVSVQEHYNIHLNQGDLAAALKIASRLNVSVEEKSNLARLYNLKRVADGTHQFLGGEIQHQRVLDGTHHFLGGEISRKTTIKRINDGTHNFLGGEIGGRTSRKRVTDGTHNFLGNKVKRNTSKISGDNHPNKVKVTCPHCNLTGGKVNLKRYHFDNCKHKH